jgi:hypothetical protein
LRIETEIRFKDLSVGTPFKVWEKSTNIFMKLPPGIDCQAKLLAVNCLELRTGDTYVIGDLAAVYPVVAKIVEDVP